MSEVNTGRWWGEFELADDERRWWTLGPLLLGAERRQREWRFGYEESANGDAATAETNRALDELANAGRFVFANPGAEIRLTPALADRPVVTRPLSPLYIAPGEEAMLFVSSPPWVRIEAVEPKPLFIFLGFSDSALNFQFSVWASQANFLEVRNRIQEEIKLAFDEAGIEIPFPHRTLYTGSATEPFPVKVVEDPDAASATVSENGSGVSR